MYLYSRHGTSCAGVAAADKNSLCVIGTAYGADLAGMSLYRYMGMAVLLFFYSVFYFVNLNS